MSICDVTNLSFNVQCELKNPGGFEVATNVLFKLIITDLISSVSKY